MKSKIKALIALVLALSLLCSVGLAAFAEEEESADSSASAAAESVDEEPSGEDSQSIIDSAALESLVDELLDSYGLSEEQRDGISFAYTYLATGDSWFYNADTWYYAASMYKVPMMMVLAQREHEGELTLESDLGGVTLAQALELILIYSNNDYAHVVRKYLGGDEVARGLYQQYSPLPEDYYHSDFIDYCYFSPRYMNDVMTTLHNRNEEFPHIKDCLVQAMPHGFYHLYLDPSIQIAQKYGSFKEFNNNTGIIYTPNPIILTVMTDCMSYDKAQDMMGRAAQIFVDYTYTLDARLTEYEAEQERLAQEEAERKAEEERIAQELAEQARQAEEERLAQEEAARIAEQERLQAEAEAAERKERIKLYGAVALGLVLIALGLSLMISSSRKKKQQQRQAAGRRATRSRRDERSYRDERAYRSEQRYNDDRAYRGERVYREERSPRNERAYSDEQYYSDERDYPELPRRRNERSYRDEYDYPQERERDYRPRH